MTATAKVRNANGPRDRARRRRQGDAQRRRQAPHPLHEHLRRGAGLDHVALPGPGPSAADGAEPDVRRRQLDRRDDRGRRWRRDLRAGRPVQGGQLAVRRQPLRPHRPGPRRRRDPRAQPVTRASRCTSSTAPSAAQGRAAVLQRRRAEQHRRLVGGAQQRAAAQHARSATAPTRPAAARRAAAAAARSTPTATCSPCGSPARSCEDNKANEGGGAVFFVSNDRTGTMRIEGSTLRGNPSDGLRDAGLPGHLLPRRPATDGQRLDPAVSPPRRR